MEKLTGNEFAWMFIGIPAVLAWMGLGLAYLLAPHLAVEPQPLLWALYGVGGWCAFLIVVFGGWLGLFALAGIAWIIWKEK